MLRKVVDQPKAPREEIVNDLKAAGTAVTKNTIGNTGCCNTLKYCSTCKFPFSRRHVHTSVFSLPVTISI